MKGARTPRRRTWADMDHDDALLLEKMVRRSRVEHGGPIAEFLAKKQAEQGRSALRRHTDLAVENLLLRHQLSVALRSRSRPRFRRRDKLL